MSSESSKLHYNSETGKVGRCKAEKGGCPFVDASDPNGGHYETQEEIDAYIERRAERETDSKTLLGRASVAIREKLEDSETYFKDRLNNVSDFFKTTWASGKMTFDRAKRAITASFDAFKNSGFLPKSLKTEVTAPGRIDVSNLDAKDYEGGNRKDRRAARKSHSKKTVITTLAVATVMGLTACGGTPVKDSSELKFNDTSASQTIDKINSAEDITVYDGTCDTWEIYVGGEEVANISEVEISDFGGEYWVMKDNDGRVLSAQSEDVELIGQDATTYDHNKEKSGAISQNLWGMEYKIAVLDADGIQKGSLDQDEFNVMIAGQIKDNSGNADWTISAPFNGDTNTQNLHKEDKDNNDVSGVEAVWTYIAAKEAKEENGAETAASYRSHESNTNSAGSNFATGYLIGALMSNNNSGRYYYNGAYNNSAPSYHKNAPERFSVTDAQLTKNRDNFSYSSKSSAATTKGYSPDYSRLDKGFQKMSDSGKGFGGDVKSGVSDIESSNKNVDTSKNIKSSKSNVESSSKTSGFGKGGKTGGGSSKVG